MTINSIIDELLAIAASDKQEKDCLLAENKALRENDYVKNTANMEKTIELLKADAANFRVTIENNSNYISELQTVKQELSDHVDALNEHVTNLKARIESNANAYLKDRDKRNGKHDTIIKEFNYKIADCMDRLNKQSGVIINQATQIEIDRKFQAAEVMKLHRTIDELTAENKAYSKDYNEVCTELANEKEKRIQLAKGLSGLLGV